MAHVKEQLKSPGALPMPEPMPPVGTLGEGAPGDQPPAVDEEAEPAPTPTPVGSTF